MSTPYKNRSDYNQNFWARILFFGTFLLVIVLSLLFAPIIETEYITLFYFVIIVVFAVCGLAIRSTDVARDGFLLFFIRIRLCRKDNYQKLDPEDKTKKAEAYFEEVFGTKPVKEY
jgi:hypothetical protein